MQTVSAVSLLPLVSALLSAVLMTVATVVPSRHTRATVFFILLNAANAVWTFAYFLRLNVAPGRDPALAAPGSSAYLVFALLLFGAAATPTAWFLFGAAASGRERITRGGYLLAACVPLAYTMAVGLTNPWHRLFVAEDGGFVVYGVLARLHHLSTFALGTTGFLLFLGSLWVRPEGRRLDVVSLGASAILPYAGSVMWMTRDLTHIVSPAMAVPVLQPLGNVVLTVLVFRTGLADIVPVGMMRTLMENTDAQVAFLDPRLKFVSANTAFLRRVGLAEEQLGGRAFSQVVANDEVLAVAEHARRLKEPVEHRAWPDALGQDRDGPTSYWNWSLRPVMSRQRLRGFVFSIADVTDEVRNAEFGAALGALSRRLHSSFDPHAVLPPVVASAGDLLHADWCALVLADDDGWRWVKRCTPGPPGWETFDPMKWSHLRLSLEMRRPVIVADAAQDPLTTEQELAEGVRRILTVPLISGDRATGAMSFASSSPGHYAPAQIAFVHEFARTVVLALENARLYHSERMIAETLQDALLTVPERIDGLEVAHAYRSATEAARVGGDFYDLFQLDSSTVALVIADVSGKGVEAAALTSLVKSALRSEALRFASPGSVLTMANELLRRQLEVGTFVTAFFGMLELESGLLRYASAGHPGPFVVRRTGAVERLEKTPGVLGAFESVDYPCRETALERGDLLLLYTDGLVETRREYGPVEEDLSPLLARLAAHVPEEVVDAVIAHASEACGGGLHDDVAVLAVRLA